jgi:hypothetical protein
MKKTIFFAFLTLFYERNASAEVNYKKFNCEVVIELGAYPEHINEVREMVFKRAKQCNGEKRVCPAVGNENLLISADLDQKSFTEITFEENSEKCLKRAMSACYIARVGVIKTKKVTSKFNNVEQDTFVCKEHNVIQNISKNPSIVSEMQMNDSKRGTIKLNEEKNGKPSILDINHAHSK